MKKCMRFNHKMLPGIVFLILLCEAAVGQVADNLHNSSNSIGDSRNESFNLHSEILNEEIRIYVSLPESYQYSKVNYPVLYVLDAPWTFNLYRSSSRYLSDFFTLGIQVPEIIIIGIANSDRDKDYTPTRLNDYNGMSFPTSGGAKPFLSFIKEELSPYIEEHYRTVEHRSISGWSLGGLFSTYAFLNNSDGFFKGFLGISPSIWWEDEILLSDSSQIIQKKPVKIVTTIGEVEMGGMNYKAAERFHKILSSDTTGMIDCVFIEIIDLGHNLSLPIAVYKGLLELYSEWVYPQDSIGSGFGAIESFYNDLSKKYDLPFFVPVSSIISESIPLSKVDIDKAIVLLTEAEGMYPRNTYIKFYLARFYSISGQNDKAIEYYNEALLIESSKDLPDQFMLNVYRRNLMK